MSTSTTHRHFDPSRFREQHRVQIAEPLRDGAQQRLDGRVRAIVEGPGGLIAYDSQKEHGEAGIFRDRAEAVDHAHAWIDAVVKREERRETLEHERRHALADIEYASQRREKDLYDQRAKLTKAMNDERKLQAKLAAEARDPQVSIEFRGGSVFLVVDDPSVFDGTLTVDGEKVSRKPTRTDPPPPPPPPGASAPPPAERDPVEATQGRLAADRYSNGNAPQGDVVAALEAYPDYLERSTCAAIALGDFGRKKRRAALDDALEQLGRVPRGSSRDELLAMLDRDGKADFAAAAMVTSTSTSTGDLTGWIELIEDGAILRWAMDREQTRSKPRAKILALIDERLKATTAWEPGGDQ